MPMKRSTTHQTEASQGTGGCGDSRSGSRSTYRLKYVVSQAQIASLQSLFSEVVGAALRSGETQSILGELASIPGICFIASMDHINAPLLWDKRTATNFNWVYQELTTFVPYNQETKGIQPLLCSTL